MSTILVTPKYVTWDYTVVSNYHPKQVKIDPRHRKVFVDPDKRFLFCTAGEYYPEEIDHPDTYELCTKLLKRFIEDHRKTNEFYIVLENEMLKERYTKIFKEDLKHILVTKKHIFLMYQFDNKTKDDSLKESVIAVIKEEGACLGSGGYIALGMHIGGFNLEQIWQNLPNYDETTSPLYDSFNLDDLVDFDF